MVKLGGGLRLVAEPLQLPRIQCRREREHLDGNAPAQGKLNGFIDHAHSAAANLADEPEIPQWMGG